VAFPDTRARQLARVSTRRLRYWEETGLVVPSVRRQLSPKNTIRLYSFADLLSLPVVAELRTERDMSLQHIRRVVEHLRSRGYEAPLRELRFATLGQEMYFQHSDGTWEGDLRPDQRVLEKVLHLDPLRARIMRAAERQASEAGQVTKRRGVHASADYLRQGYDTDAILTAFPDLKAADVAEASKRPYDPRLGRRPGRFAGLVLTQACPHRTPVAAGSGQHLTPAPNSPHLARSS
jgi:DNA-binding transcriptional MerR regulator